MKPDYSRQPPDHKMFEVEEWTSNQITWNTLHTRWLLQFKRDYCNYSNRTVDPI